MVSMVRWMALETTLQTLPIWNLIKDCYYLLADAELVVAVQYKGWRDSMDKT